MAAIEDGSTRRCKRQIVIDPREKRISPLALLSSQRPLARDTFIVSFLIDRYRALTFLKPFIVAAIAINSDEWNVLLEIDTSAEIESGFIGFVWLSKRFSENCGKYSFFSLFFVSSYVVTIKKFFLIIFTSGIYNSSNPIGSSSS